MSSETLSPYGEAEKKRVALTSVMAAVFLTGIKIVVGIMTGSLGILAEALHSGLDLVAAVITWVAVHLSDKPADADHPYGHGKIESFSALFETVLLFVTCGWVIWEAVQRLFFKEVEVLPSAWAFAVMAVSILVDFGRSRAPLRVARKYKSQALEADALHFSTDIWSSAVVILGLLGVKAGEWIGHKNILVNADAVAALGVAVIVFWVSWQLVKSTLDVLLDRAPKGFADEVTAKARTLSGVVDCRRVRVRHVGPAQFVDLVLDVPRTMPLERAHTITHQLEDLVRKDHPQADIVVHFEPVAVPSENWSERVQAAAGLLGFYVHNVRVNDVKGYRTLFYHLEVDPLLTLTEAHALADHLEEEIRRQMTEIHEVNTHIENRTDMVVEGEVANELRPKVETRLKEILSAVPGMSCHEIQVYRQEKRLIVALHCGLDGKQTVAEAHRLSSRIEENLRRRMPEISRVQIHVEPS
jgi:cation diffusion facilitator family transporter